MNEDESPKRRVSDKNKRKNLSAVAKLQKYIIDKLQPVFDKKDTAKVAIFTHPSPDPDAIGSQMGLSWLLRKAYEHIEVDCYYDGRISHPQNQRMFNLLDPDLKKFGEDRLPEYDLIVCVDTIPKHCFCPKDTKFDLVIDHHKEPPNGDFNGLYLNLKAGSCCATIYQLIKQYGLTFDEDNSQDTKVATGLLVGVITDTEYQTSDDTTDFEHESYRDLFEFRNSNALKQITRYKQPREWVEARAAVAQKAHDRIVDGVLIHGIGFIGENNRDLIAAVADEMLSWENVETSVAFAVVEGNRIEGSVRSNNAALAVPALCKELGGEYGNGGGKLGKGAYSYTLGSCSADDEMDGSTKDKLLDFINEREFKRVSKILKSK